MESNLVALKRIKKAKANKSPLLDLSELGMTTLPTEIGLLTNLESLTLNNNQLESLPKAIDDKIHDINVSDLLNGLDLANNSRARNAVSNNTRLKLFYSYSHEDETLRKRLETHLKILERQNIIESWHDRDIDASDYCYELEMKRVLERHENKEAPVIPIIIRSVQWQSAPFARLQVLPKDAKPVELWSNHDQAWQNVTEGIEQVIKSMSTKTNKTGHRTGHQTNKETRP